MENIKTDFTKYINLEFPVLNQYIYANTAATGLICNSLLEWRRQHDIDFLMGGSMMKMQSFEVISETRKTVGSFFGCTTENVALVQNFSLGLNMLLEGLDKKHKVLLLEDDYPSVNWPFESRGFPISFVGIGEHLEENIFEKVRSNDISVLALSLVQWQNGIKIDLDFLKKLKRDFPDLLIIADGTQFCGTIEFDFETSGIDVLGASAYKWLLAGYGNGFMLFKDWVKERISVKTIGFNAANADKEAKQTLRFAKHFEPGHLDTLNFGSLKFSLNFLETVGMKQIAEHNRKLCQKAKTEFTDLGLLNHKIVARPCHGNIFNIKGDDTLFRNLLNNNIVCVRRAEGIRMSFHLYNSENDIEEIVGILKRAL